MPGAPLHFQGHSYGTLAIPPDTEHAGVGDSADRA